MRSSLRWHRSPGRDDAVTTLADSSLATLFDRVASSDPAPGAGPSAGWTCALAAALVQMVSAVALRKDPPELAVAVQRRDRAAEPRARALVHRDVAAYTEVLSVLRRRDEPRHGRRLRGALSEAANRPLAIAEVAAEVTRLAADAGSEARGAVRGEVMTAAVLAEAVVRAGGIPLIELNLAGAGGDPRRIRVHELAEGARADLDRALKA
jgi:formiminotetrahydrofolate cyclodeaminase